MIARATGPTAATSANVLQPPNKVLQRKLDPSPAALSRHGRHLKHGQEMAVERMASMENQLVQLRQDGVYTRADMARLEHRLDGVELRLELRGETP